MKKIAIAMMLCVGLAAHAQWYTGMSQQTGLVLCIHLSDSAAELYSPLQTQEPIPVSAWSLQGDTLRMECKSIGFKTVLVRCSPETGELPAGVRGGWRGYWKQGFMKEDITFVPADTMFQLRRPQTPVAQYGFDEETVTTDYTDSQGNAVHLEGTLTYPKGGGRYPCIVLVSGSGQQNRDEEIMQHKPFLVLADYFASRGIAVLRYDDRGVGASSGSLDSATTRLFAEDAEAMFNAVKGNKHVDAKRLGIGGHSEGGAIAPMVAARNKYVKFVVMLAGQGCTGLEVMVQQNEALFRSRGVSERLCKVRGACMRELMVMPLESKLKDYQAVILRHTEGLSKAEADSVELKKGMAHALKQQLTTSWMQAFIHLDPQEYLPKVKCPVLALNGTKDCQVIAAPNLERIKALNSKADCRSMEGLNHLFQHCTTGDAAEYMLIEETFAPEAMKAVADWILGL